MTIPPDGYDAASLVTGPAGTNTGLTMSEVTESTQGRLRRLNLMMLFPVVVVAGVLTVAFDAQAWWHVVVLALGVIAALVAFVRWTSGDLARVALPCVIVAAAVWAVGAIVIDSGMAVFGIVVVGPLTIPQLPRRRGAAAAALVAFVAAVGVVKLAMSPDDVRTVLIRFLLIPTGVTAIVTGLMFPNKRFYDVVADLEESREREAELAVVRERMRFASDLHDIQGHTLHVVKLKTALARKLVRSDPARAEHELDEINTLVGDTIAQTKELVYAQRRLNLPAELENAKNLFEAAGIAVHVHRAADPDTHAGELLGQVLRETTTNVLRHAQAREVWITLSEAGLTIVNDGVHDSPPAELSGLAILERRVADNGGKLTVRQEDGRFVTAAEFPHLRADSPEHR